MKAQIKVGVLVMNERSEILLIKEKLPNTGQAKWNIIKGTHEDNKETVLETAVRECREEASAEVRLTHALGIYFYGDKEPRIQFNFLATAKNDKIAVPNKYPQKLRDEDITDVRWFKREELTKLKESDYVSRIAYRIIQDWLTTKNKFPLNLYK
mgnify:CR=1 FL=1